MKRLFNWLAECLPLTRLFNAFARPSGPSPKPIKIDPTWFPVPEPSQEMQPPSEPEHAQPEDWDDGFDPHAFAYDNPGWDEEDPEDDLYTIAILPDEPVPPDAGDFLRTYYAPGIGDVRVYARLDPNEMDIDPGQIIELDEWDDEPAPESTPKPPK